VIAAKTRFFVFLFLLLCDVIFARVAAAHFVAVPASFAEDVSRVRVDWVFCKQLSLRKALCLSHVLELKVSCEVRQAVSLGWVFTLWKSRLDF